MQFLLPSAHLCFVPEPEPTVKGTPRKMVTPPIERPYQNHSRTQLYRNVEEVAKEEAKRH